MTTLQPTNPDSLQDKCVEIQALTQLTDPAWKRQFGNEQGLYGFVTLAVKEAYKKGYIDGGINTLTEDKQ